MSAVGRRTEHAGQTTITQNGLHAHFEKARAALMRVSAMLQGWVTHAAEQLNLTTVWNLVCDQLKRKRLDPVLIRFGASAQLLLTDRGNPHHLAKEVHYLLRSRQPA